MRGFLHASVLTFAWFYATAASAEIHDYMILRLVYLNTQCGTEELKRIESAPAHRRFKVTCRNVSAYPDGLTVLCTDPDDDRSCRSETKPRKFEDQRLLRDAPDARR